MEVMQEMGKLSKEKICPSIEYDGELSISEGTSRTTKIWKNKTIKWSDLLVMLSKPVETFETADEYQKFPKSKKDDIKDVGGIVGGWLKQGKRKRGYVQQRSMVILDADSTTNDLWDDVKLLFDHAAAICTTHSHSAKNTRYRLFIPLSRPVTAEEYPSVPDSSRQSSRQSHPGRRARSDLPRIRAWNNEALEVLRISSPCISRGMPPAL